jgi:hypothetical protein
MDIEQITDKLKRMSTFSRALLVLLTVPTPLSTGLGGNEIDEVEYADNMVGNKIRNISPT